MSISYLDGPRLKRAVLAACHHGQRVKGELNRINVFPVPDGDTGTNLALTLRSIAERLSGVRDRRIDRVAAAVAEGAVLGARGNCGMMLSHFLLGLSRDLDGTGRVGTERFGGAFWAGATALENALDDPVEGTIVTVIRESADEARNAATADFAAFMLTVRERARVALAGTPELLPVLREAGVVDAGAKGFVSLLEGVVRLIEGTEWEAPGGEPGEGIDDPSPSPVALAEYPHREGGRYRYCTEGLVQGADLPSEDEVRAALREGAEELIVIRTGQVLKVHLHTDEPEDAFAYLRGLGALVAHKAEDMHAQHDTVRRSHGAVRRSVGIVTDSASDLPDPVVKAHGIGIVPLQLVEGDRSLRDRFDVSAEEFHRRMAAAGSLPTTSQPTPGSFVEAFESAATEAESLVAVVLGSRLSGTFASAEAAAGLVPDAGVRVVDSGGASLLTGLLALRAAELAESGLEADAIVQEVNRIRRRSNILFTVRTLDRLIASGRVSRFAGWLGGVLDLKPVLGLEVDGSVKAYGKARGDRKVRRLILDRVEKEIGPAATRVRFGLVHVGAPELLGPVEEELRGRFGREVEMLTAPATPVLATHLGIGAWGVAYTVED